MSRSGIGVALVHEVCPICGKAMNHSILMNSKISKECAEEVEDMHGKAVGYSKDACEECLKYKDSGVFCIAIDEKRSDRTDVYRTGQLSAIRKDFQLFLDHPEFIIKTDNGVSYCFVDENAGKTIGFFK